MGGKSEQGWISNGKPMKTRGNLEKISEGKVHILTRSATFAFAGTDSHPRIHQGHLGKRIHRERDTFHKPVSRGGGQNSFLYCRSAHDVIEGSTL